MDKLPLSRFVLLLLVSKAAPYGLNVTVFDDVTGESYDAPFDGVPNLLVAMLLSVNCLFSQLIT